MLEASPKQASGLLPVFTHDLFTLPPSYSSTTRSTVGHCQTDHCSIILISIDTALLRHYRHFRHWISTSIFLPAFHLHTITIQLNC